MNVYTIREAIDAMRAIEQTSPHLDPPGFAKALVALMLARSRLEGALAGALPKEVALEPEKVTA